MLGSIPYVPKEPCPEVGTARERARNSKGLSGPNLTRSKNLEGIAGFGTLRICRNYPTTRTVPRVRPLDPLRSVQYKTMTPMMLSTLSSCVALVLCCHLLSVVAATRAHTYLLSPAVQQAALEPIPFGRGAPAGPGPNGLARTPPMGEWQAWQE